MLSVSWFQRRFLSFSNYKSVEANDPQGMANFDPIGMVDKSYVGFIAIKMFLIISL